MVRILNFNECFKLTDFTESDIDVHEEIVLITTKGEAIALGYAMMSAVEMSTCDHGVVAKIKRVIMERDLYPRRWGMGPVALEKKKMKESGKLDKFGRTNENTPASWKTNYKDFDAPDGQAAEGAGTTAQPLQEKTSKEDVSKAPPAPALDYDGEEDEDDDDDEAEVVKNQPSTPPNNEKKDKKKRKHEGETPEERAERKKKKAEKKAKKEKRKSAKSAAEDSD